jgi:transcription elongation factor Elf1
MVKKEELRQEIDQAIARIDAKQERGESSGKCPRCGKMRVISTKLASGLREVCLDCGYTGNVVEPD